MKKELNEIELIRYRNTRFLIETHCGKKASQKVFAETVGIDPSYVSNIASKKITSVTKAIGEKVAREIETAFKKPQNWLDRPNYDAAPVATEEAQIKDQDPKIYRVEESLPVLTLNEAEMMRSGILCDQKSNRERYLIPLGIKPSESAFAFRETTTLMYPFKPGDLYLVDPTVSFAPEDVVLCNLAGAGLVGILKRGAQGFKLAFYDKTEPPIQIDAEQIIGPVIYQSCKLKSSENN